MKYLSDYTQEKQTALFKQLGAFFAFSQKQFDEQKKEGTKYFDIGAGLICPKENAEKLIEGLEQINEEGINQDVEDNGKVAIIHRELANHECQLTGTPARCIEKLKDYPITKEEIMEQWKPYLQKCIDNKWF